MQALNGLPPHPPSPDPPTGEATPQQATPAPETAREQALAGMANVAALTFLAARAVPLGWTVAVTAGVPLARAAQRDGARPGYAAAGASLIDTLAIMGPARMSIPIPHALSAPWLGALARRRARFLWLALAGAVVRIGYYTVTSAFSILIIIGSQAYLGSYEHVRHLAPFLPAGQSWALILTAVANVVWSLGAGLIQAWVVARGLARWSEAPAPAASEPRRSGPDPARSAAARSGAARGAGTMVLAAVAGFVVALASTDPWVLGALAVVLAVTWVLTRAGWRDLLRGAALAAPLAISTFLFGAFGGIGASAAGRRGVRVLLLVLIAAWVRAAAGSDGLRAVSLRIVRRLQRLPTLALMARILGASAGITDWGPGARRLGRRLGRVRRRPVPVIDAVLSWVAEESEQRGAATPR